MGVFISLIPVVVDHRPLHPNNAKTEHVGCSPTRKTSRAPSAKGRELFGESCMKGELHPTKNNL